MIRFPYNWQSPQFYYHSENALVVFKPFIFCINWDRRCNYNTETCNPAQVVSENLFYCFSLKLSHAWAEPCKNILTLMSPPPAPLPKLLKENNIFLVLGGLHQLDQI